MAKKKQHFLQKQQDGQFKNEASERLQALLIAYGLSQIEFARAIGMGESTISMLLSGERDVAKSSLLDKIRLYYPKTNVDWLLTGTGEMFLLSSEVSEPSVGYANIEQQIKAIRTDQGTSRDEVLDQVLKMIDGLGEEQKELRELVLKLKGE